MLSAISIKKEKEIDKNQYKSESKDKSESKESKDKIIYSDNNIRENHNMIYQMNPIINISQTLEKDTILLEYNYKDKKFLFHDKNKNFLGSFTTDELIKYIICSKIPNFMPSVNYTSSQYIINKYFCELDTSKDITKVLVKNHLESPFTGHIEMLIKLYKNIEEYEKTNLIHDLSLLNNEEKIIVINIFNQFTYTILNHILKMISILTDIIKNDDNPEMKHNLLKYSVAIMYKISNHIKNQINTKLNDIDSLKNEKSKLDSIKETLGHKVLSIEQQVLEQNMNISKLVNLIKNTNLVGGGDINSSLMSDSSSDKSYSQSNTDTHNTLDSTDTFNNFISSSSSYTNSINTESQSTSLTQLIKSSNTSSDKFNNKSSNKSSSNKSSSNKSSNNKMDYLLANNSSSHNKVFDL
jgi:hypothetical protein